MTKDALTSEPPAAVPQVPGHMGVTAVDPPPQPAKVMSVAARALLAAKNAGKPASIAAGLGGATAELTGDPPEPTTARAPARAQMSTPRKASRTAAEDGAAAGAECVLSPSVAAGAGGGATTPGGSSRQRQRRPAASVANIVAGIKAKYDTAVAAAAAGVAAVSGAETQLGEASPLPPGGQLSTSVFNKEVKPGLVKLAYLLARHPGGMRREALEGPLPGAGGVASDGEPSLNSISPSMLEVLQSVLPQGSDAWQMLVRCVRL